MRKKSIENKSGMTLIELIVVMGLCMILATGVYQVFLANTRTYAVTDELNLLQEEGRMALHYLRSEIMGAGYLGCSQQPQALNNTLPISVPPNPDFAFDFANGIDNPVNIPAGILNNPVPAVPATTPALLQVSEFLVVRGIGRDVPRMSTTAPVIAGAGLININTGLTLNPGTLLLISDCNSATVFWAGAYNAVTGVLSLPIVPAPAPPINLGADGFVQGADLYIPQTQIFYVANDPLNNNEPSLYVARNFMNPVAYQTDLLVTGVEMMQVLYGEDTDNDGQVNAYVGAAAVVNWQDVLSVRIALLLRARGGDSSAPVDNNLYDLFGDGVNDFNASLAQGNNRVMRLIFSGTIGLRNRIR